MFIVVLFVFAATAFVAITIFQPSYIGEFIRKDIERLTWQKPPPTRLYDIQICGDAGLATGRDGIVLESEDGGRRWSNIDSGTDESLRKIVFLPDCQSAFIAGDEGTTLHFSNNRRKLEHVSSNTKDNLTGIAWSTDGKTAVAVGDNGTIRVYQKNGEQRWVDPGNILGNDLNGVAVSADGRTVVVVGDEKSLAYSTNSGARDSWENKTVEDETNQNFYAVAFNSSGYAVAVGEDGLIWIYDASKDPKWISIGTNAKKDLNAISFSSDGTAAIAVGDDGIVLVSVNAQLRDWKPMNTSVSHDLNDVAMAPDGKQVIAVGDSGTVLLLPDITETEGGWCKPDTRTPKDLFAVSFAGENGAAVAVGREDDRATLVMIDTHNCASPATHINVELPDVGVAKVSSVYRGSAVDPDKEFVFSFAAIIIVRILAVTIFLIMFWQLINLTRYHLHLATFYYGRANAVITIDPTDPPLSQDIETFKQSMKVATPDDLGFERTPRGVLKDILRIARTVSPRRNDGNDT